MSLCLMMWSLFLPVCLLPVQLGVRRLENDPTLTERSCLSVGDICGLLSLCLDATYLTFEGKIYRQIHGTAMGSPVSVVVANLVMKDVEQKALFTFHPPPHFWRRHVDDMYTASSRPSRLPPPTP